MRSARSRIAALAAAVLVGGVLAGALPVAAGTTTGKSSGFPWPILRVMKTLGKATQLGPGEQVEVPAGTVFSVKVTCEYPTNEEGVEANGSSFPETLLTFDSNGAPVSASEGGWQNLGDGYWTFQGPELKYKLCTAEETDVTPPPPGLLEVQYKCDASSTEVVNGVSEEEEADATTNVAEFGCVLPPTPGVYQPVANAQVQFTAPWDRESCGIVEAGEDVSGQGGSKCQQTGTLTVDNLDPAWVVGGLVARFTG